MGNVHGEFYARRRASPPKESETLLNIDRQYVANGGRIDGRQHEVLKQHPLVRHHQRLAVEHRWDRSVDSAPGNGQVRSAPRQSSCVGDVQGWLSSLPRQDKGRRLHAVSLGDC